MQSGLRPTTLLTVVAGLCAIAMSVTGCGSSGNEKTEVEPTLPMSDAQIVRETLDQQWMEIQSQHPSASRPDVEIERLVSPDEWAAVMAQCLADEGFTTVKANSDGSIEWGDIAQAQAFDVARYACSATFPQDPKYMRPLTDAQLDKLYNYYVGDLTQCLTDLGYKTSVPPSQQVFRETYDSTPWLPFSEAASQVAGSPELRSQLDRECPQTPDDLY